MSWTPKCLAYADRREGPEELVHRSDFIVVGHVEGDTFPKVDHDPSADYNAVLVIKELIKGSLPIGKTPIVIRSDLRPVTMNWDNVVGAVILCGGGMHGPVSGDIRQDRVWFLRSGDPKDAAGKPTLGISRPVDTEDKELKLYYAAFLSDHPEDILRKYLDGEPKLARACHAYVDPIDIAQIVKIPNPTDRIDKLIPFLLFRESFNPKENDETVPNSETMPTVSNSYNLRDNDAQKQLILCGKGVGEKLVPIFLDPNYEYMRMEIMTMWADLNYKEATPYIVSLLQQEDEHWAHPDVPHPIDNDRANSWSRLRISCALKTLASLRDPRAKAVILQTKKRWVAFGTADPSQAIVPLCDAALKAIEEPAAPH